jgi:hypothetical protein
MELCYTLSMNNDLHIRRTWAQALYRWGVNDIIASLLEAAGPLTILVAQVIYIGQPLVVHGRLRNSLTVLADMLEKSEDTQAFISLLREESQHDPA